MKVEENRRTETDGKHSDDNDHSDHSDNSGPPTPPVLAVQPSVHYANILEEAVETSESRDEALQKLNGFIQDAKQNNRIPDMMSILGSVVSLTQKYANEEETIRAYIYI